MYDGWAWLKKQVMMVKKKRKEKKDGVVGSKATPST